MFILLFLGTILTLPVVIAYFCYRIYPQPISILIGGLFNFLGLFACCILRAIKTEDTHTPNDKVITFFHNGFIIMYGGLFCVGMMLFVVGTVTNTISDYNKQANYEEKQAQIQLEQEEHRIRIEREAEKVEIEIMKQKAQEKRLALEKEKERIDRLKKIEENRQKWERIRMIEEQNRLKEERIKREREREREREEARIAAERVIEQEQQQEEEKVSTPKQEEETEKEVSNIIEKEDGTIKIVGNNKDFDWDAWREQKNAEKEKEEAERKRRIRQRELEREREKRERENKKDNKQYKTWNF